MLYTYLKTLWFEYKEQRKVSHQFYTHTAFAQLDQQLLAQCHNPYKIAAQFLRQRGAEKIHTYGETPLTTMDKIVKECAIFPNERLIEMGGGRGRAALFLAAYHNLHVTCYELVPTFIEKMVPHEKLQMKQGDMFEADFSLAQNVYLYGTMLEETQIKKLSHMFPVGCKIITVSYPLSDYDHRYLTKKTFWGTFPWGTTEIYWNERIST